MRTAKAEIQSLVGHLTLSLSLLLLPFPPSFSPTPPHQLLPPHSSKEEFKKEYYPIMSQGHALSDDQVSLSSFRRLHSAREESYS